MATTNPYSYTYDNMRKIRERHDREYAIKKAIFWAIAIPVCFILGFLTSGCGTVNPETTDNTPYVTETVTEDVSAEHAQTDAYWRSWKETDFETGMDDGIRFNSEKAVINFNDTVAVGVGLEDGVITTVEADAGFILSVVDENTASVKFYNNCGEDVTVKYVTAELIGAKRFVCAKPKDEYLIKGYEKCKNGVGIVTMKLSTGDILEAGVFKQDGELYAVNLVKKSDADNILIYRKKLDEAMEKFHVTTENTLFTENIYYPIVPMTAQEKTDVEPWIELSDELVEEDWTDAHKLYALYSWCVDNLAYDEWMYSMDEHSRTFYYKEFNSGKYFLSKTHVGVCEDFSQALAIMCRAQGIPAVVTAGGDHAWNDIYIADYGRWVRVDLTNDVTHQARTEDVTDITEYSYKPKRYSSIDRYTYGVSKIKSVGIGNYADMVKQGLKPYYSEDAADEDAADDDAA